MQTMVAQTSIVLCNQLCLRAHPVTLIESSCSLMVKLAMSNRSLTVLVKILAKQEYTPLELAMAVIAISLNRLQVLAEVQQVSQMTEQVIYVDS